MAQNTPTESENYGTSDQFYERWPVRVALLLILLLAFGLRVYDLASLSLHGDYAYSVYAARRDLATIALERLLDGHPPLYYYLLHIWMIIFGQNELTIRMLSVLLGVPAVGLIFSFGARHFGRRVGLVGALLVAVSPALVHYSRQPRMYTLLVLLALLSTYTLSKALERGRGRHWLGYVIATTLLLYTHYYGLALVVAEAAYIFWLRYTHARRSLRSLVPVGALAVAYLPWLLFAGATSATVTAGIISNAPWPQDIRGLLEQYWIPFNVGDFLDVEMARPLALIVLVVWIAVLWLNRLYIRGLCRGIGLLVFSIVVPIAASLLIFVFMPYGVRPRFLIFCIPIYLLLLATALIGKRRWITALGLLVVLVASTYALMEAYKAEPYVVENDAIMLTEYLQGVSQPEDGVILQAFWHIGYFTTHYRGIPPTTYNMRDLSVGELDAILSRHPRVWLGMFRAPTRSSEYPLEEWLDRNWHRVEERQMEETRLISYVRPKRDGWQATPVNFEAPDGTPALRLTSVQLLETEIKPGHVIAAGLRWQAPRSLSERYTIFLQLQDSNGRRWAGTDSEPLGGSEPTAGWQEGQLVEDHMALTVPTIIPPGDYSLLVGVYPTGTPQPLIAKGSDGSIATRGVSVGRVRVSGYRVEDLPMRHSLGQRLGSGIALLGYDLDIDWYQVGATRTVNTFKDTPVKLSFPKRVYQVSDTIELTLYWQALQPVNEDYTIFVHLKDSTERLWSQADSQPVMGHFPTSRWRTGEVVVDKYRLAIGNATPPGDYQIQVGMYLLSNMRRLPVVSPLGTTDNVELRRVRIEPERR